MKNRKHYDTVHDLATLVIELRAPRSLYLTNYMGRAVYALGLCIIALSNQPLATSLHDQNSEKPFAVSGLMRDNQALFGNVEAASGASIRLMGARIDVVRALEKYQRVMGKRLLKGKPFTLQIDYVDWQVSAIYWDDLSIPSLFSYRQLIERHQVARPNDRVILHFCTATTFRSQGVNIPLPNPDHVFSGLLKRWIMFTAHRLRDLPDDQLSAFIQYHIVISRFNLSSTLYRFKNGGKEVGFIGDVTYDLLHRSEYLEKHEPNLEAALKQDYLWFARTINLLADFATFSSVGRKTTWGMGMVR